MPIQTRILNIQITLTSMSYIQPSLDIILPLLKSTITTIKYNNAPRDNEQCKNDLYRLTTALITRQFTHIGYKQSLTLFTAPKTNDYSIDHYNHEIIRPNEDHFLNDDKFANQELTEKLFIRTPYVFALNSLDKKHDHIILKHSVIFKLTIQIILNLTSSHHSFTFSHPKNVICTVHTTSCYQLNKHTLILFTYLYKITTHCPHHHDNLTININSLTPSIPHHSFLTSLIVLKLLTFKASSEILIPSPRCIFSVP